MRKAGAEKSGRCDSERRKSKAEIMRGSIKLNGEIPVCVAVTVDDLQVTKSKISDSMSALRSQETNLLGDHY